MSGVKWFPGVVKKRGVFGVLGGYCFEGSRGSLIRCSGRARGPEGVLLGSYLRCLGRFRCQNMTCTDPKKASF